MSGDSDGAIASSASGAENVAEDERGGAGEFGELLRYTAAGFAGGLILAGALDRLGLQRSGLGQWAVRTLSGEGESLFEGVYALRRDSLAAPARRPRPMVGGSSWEWPRPGRSTGSAVCLAWTSTVPRPSTFPTSTR